MGRNGTVLRHGGARVSRCTRSAVRPPLSRIGHAFAVGMQPDHVAAGTGDGSKGVGIGSERNAQAGRGQVILEQIGKHTSELQSLMRISYAVFCLKKKISLSNTTLHSTQRLIYYTSTTLPLQVTK